jgi:hypothetical protein
MLRIIFLRIDLPDHSVLVATTMNGEAPIGPWLAQRIAEIEVTFLKKVENFLDLLRREFVPTTETLARLPYLV